MSGEKAKKYTPAQLAAVIVFMAFILVFFVLFMVLPKNTDKLDQLEFRMLAPHPIKGVAAETLSRQLARGELSDNVDAFLEDHFPLRSFFIAVDSYFNRLTGRNAVQSVVLGKNERMFDAPVTFDKEQILANVASIDGFAETYGLDTLMVIVPTSAVVAKSDLPAVHPAYPDSEILNFFKENTSAEFIDLEQFYASLVQANAADEGELYYRTDHHWTMQGAYFCYCRLCQSLGISPVPQRSFETESYEFYGSYYRKAGTWLTSPDSLEVWRSAALDSAKVTIGSGENAVEHTGVYDDTQLTEGNIDKYAAYLYSNNALTVIENPNGNGKAIMIVKDSYGNSIAPLFVETYSTVVLVDTRYYAFEPDPGELITEYGITDLIVVLGLDSATTRCNLTYLR